MVLIIITDGKTGVGVALGHWSSMNSALQALYHLHFSWVKFLRNIKDQEGEKL